MSLYKEQPEIIVPCDHVTWKYVCPECKKLCDGTGIRFEASEGGVYFAKAPRNWCVDFYGSFCWACNLLVLDSTHLSRWGIKETEKRQIEIQFRNSYYFSPAFRMRFEPNESSHVGVKGSDVPEGNPKRIANPQSNGGGEGYTEA